MCIIFPPLSPSEAVIRLKDVKKNSQIADETHGRCASHMEVETHLRYTSQIRDGTQKEHASQIEVETHELCASQIGGETHV